jgi:CTP synthase (UTP-ammonia lyase)
VRETAVIEARDVPSIYEVPLSYHAEGLDGEVLRQFGIEDAPAPKTGALAHHRAPRPQPGGRGEHRRGRQIHRPQGRV